MGAGIKCSICGEHFDSLSNLHRHIKSHGLLLGEYYVKYYPRYNLLTGKPLGYKTNRDEYFEKDFDNTSEMEDWLLNGDTKLIKPWLLKKLSDRIDKKNLRFAPSEVEMESCGLPSLTWYEKYFGSYIAVCEELKISPLFAPFKKLKAEEIKNPKIFIDTREQKPLKFKNSESQKLAIGDYTLAGDNYTYTYVDRKSESDFKGTMSQGFDRFCREIERAINLDSYLFVVIESDIKKIEKNNSKQRWGSKTCSYVFHNMREIQHKYARRVQFVFTENRVNSQKLIPYLLMYGKQLWDKDVQLFLNSKKNI